jgi:hypothetical protein
MTRLEKCELLKEKGYSYDPETGKIYGVWGKEINNKNKSGYIQITLMVDKPYILYGHHFAWYMSGKDMDFIELDHDNRNRSDNRICNLRLLTRSEQRQNSTHKGYSWDKRRQKYQSYITINKKHIYLGAFNTEQEARNAYLEGKKKYHIID